VYIYIYIYIYMSVTFNTPREQECDRVTVKRSNVFDESGRLFHVAAARSNEQT